MIKVGTWYEVCFVIYFILFYFIYSWWILLVFTNMEYTVFDSN
jgi:hypothetical protein